MYSTIFWDGMPRGLEEDHQYFRALLATSFLLVSSLVHSFTLKMEAVHFSEISVNFYQTTKHYLQRTVLFTVTTMRTSNPTM
jgi:hypothetical protein